MICNNSFIHHDRNCPDYKNNALKGASISTTAAVNQQPKQFVFNSNEVQILTKVFEICRLYVNKNSSLFQQPQDILNKLSKSIDNIQSRRQNNNQNQQPTNTNTNTKLKGASLLEEDINNNNPFKPLNNILKMVGLTTNNESITDSHLKGASDSDSNQNNICSKKEHLKDLLKQYNLI